MLCHKKKLGFYSKNHHWGFCPGFLSWWVLFWGFFLEGFAQGAFVLISTIMLKVVDQE